MNRIDELLMKVGELTHEEQIEFIHQLHLQKRELLKQQVAEKELDLKSAQQRLEQFLKFEEGIRPEKAIPPINKTYRS